MKKADLEKRVKELEAELDEIKSGKAQKDLSTFEKLQAELMGSEEYFRSLFENNSIPICLVEPDTIISRANNKLCEMIGYTHDEVHGSSWTKYIHKEDIDQLISSFNSGVQRPNSKSSSYEFRFVRKDGEVRQALMNVVVLSNRKVIASYLDITERKRMEVELVQAKDKAQ